MNAFKHLSYFFRPLPGSTVEASPEENRQKTSIIIGHKQCLAAGPYPLPLAAQIGQVKWFFAHASVGSNMLDGLEKRRLSARVCDDRSSAACFDARRRRLRTKSRQSGMEGEVRSV
jgi:hypothetical protein